MSNSLTAHSKKNCWTILKIITANITRNLLCLLIYENRRIKIYLKPFHPPCSGSKVNSGKFKIFEILEHVTH